MVDVAVDTTTVRWSGHPVQPCICTVGRFFLGQPISCHGYRTDGVFAARIGSDAASDTSVPEYGWSRNACFVHLTTGTLRVRFSIRTLVAGVFSLANFTFRCIQHTRTSWGGEWRVNLNVWSLLNGKRWHAVLTDLILAKFSVHSDQKIFGRFNRGCFQMKVLSTWKRRMLWKHLKLRYYVSEELN